MAYTLTASVPAGPAAQNVTLIGAGLSTMSIIEITKVPDAGDLWIRFDGQPAAVDSANCEYLPDGNPSGAFQVGGAAIREAQRANGDDWIVSVVYAGGGNVHFRS